MKTLSIFFTMGIFLGGFSRLYSEDFLLEARAAYFYPTASSFRSIYGNGAGLYSIEASYRACGNLYPWASAGILYKSGRTVAERTKTSVTIVPLALGLKYAFCWNCIHPYLGLGILVPYLRTNDDSSFVVRIRNKWGVGAIVKSGIIYDMANCFFADLFLDYSWTRIGFSNTDKTTGRTADISGLSVGLGLGFRF